MNNTNVALKECLPAGRYGLWARQRIGDFTDTARINAADVRGITPLMSAEGGGHILLPGLGGGTTADLLRALGGNETAPSNSTELYSQGAIR